MNKNKQKEEFKKILTNKFKEFLQANGSVVYGTDEIFEHLKEICTEELAKHCIQLGISKDKQGG